MSMQVSLMPSEDPMPLAPPEIPGASEAGQWHQNCLVVTLLLAAAFEKKTLKRLLKRSGCTEQAQEGRGEVLLQALHEACHTNQEARAAVSKELNTRFGATLHKTRTSSADEILALAQGTPWPIPQLWACYSGEDQDRQEAGRRLAHLIMAKAMKRLQGDTLVEREKQRADKFCEQNRVLRQDLDQLRAENRGLSRQLQSAQAQETAAPAAPAAPAASQEAALSAHKKRAKHLSRELEQARRDMEELRQDLAVWRALACREEGRDGPGEAGSEPAGWEGTEPCPRCGQACGGKCGAHGSCPLQGRQVAVIGGLDRLEKNYTEVIEQLGGSCLCHTGKVRSGARRLRQMVSKSDLVVFLTPINSHAALNVVKKHCKLCSTPFCPLNCTSPAALESHLKEISQGERLIA